MGPRDSEKLSRFDRRNDRIRWILTTAIGVLTFFALGYSNADETTQQIVAKSFIRKIDLAKECSGTTATLLATIANCNFSEDPQSGADDGKDFRLRSQIVVRASCSQGQIVSWDISGVATKFGKEALVLAAEGEVFEDLKAQPALRGTSAQKQVSMSYGVRGRPNVITEPSFQAVSKRSCQYIWHRVEASVACAANKPILSIKLTGSGFPSHRAWVGDGRVANIDQGPFSNLWLCDPKDSTMIK